MSNAAGVNMVNRDLGETMIHFDALPAALRKELNDAPVSIDPVGVYQGLVYELTVRGDLQRAIWAVSARIAEVVDCDLHDFAAVHRRRHGIELPHLAAGATALRAA